MIKFRGKIIKVPDIGLKWLPTAAVNISRGKRNYACEMLVDSGADLSLIPRKFGEELGLTLTKSKVKEIRGVGEAAVPYTLHRVRMEIGKYIFHVRIGWAMVEEVPFILGRLDVFDIFNIEFRQKSKTTIFRLSSSK